MGGLGSYAGTHGNNQNLQFVTVGKILDFPVLEPNGKTTQHGLPMENHTSPGYIKLYPDGIFKELRVYDDNHRCVLEIAYHRESKIAPDQQSVLHFHLYHWHDQKLLRTHAALLTKDSDLYKQYKKYLKGVPEL